VLIERSSQFSLSFRQFLLPPAIPARHRAANPPVRRYRVLRLTPRSGLCEIPDEPAIG
jgi:hypothetical protein